MDEQREWSMDGFFVLNLNSLIQKSIELSFEQNVDGFHKCIDSLITLVYPKLKEDDTFKKIVGESEQIYTLIGQAYVRGPQGEVLGSRPELIFQIKHRLTWLMRHLLDLLEKRGIYTHTKRDMNKVMGRMDM